MDPAAHSHDEMQPGNRKVNPTPPSARWRRCIPPALALVLLAIFAVRADDSLRRESPVWDETMHLDYGLNFLRFGPLVPAADHPYPVMALVTLPLALQDPAPGQVVEVRDVPGTGRQAELRQIEDPRNLYPARRMNVALAAVGLAAAAWWLSRRSGPALGLSFLALGTLDPGWLAPARYATTDVAHGLAFLGGGLALAHHRMRGGWRPLVVAGLFGTLGLAAKFSGVVLVPTALLVQLVPMPGEGRYVPRRRIIAGVSAAAVVGGVAIAGWLLLFQLHALVGLATPADGWHRVIVAWHEFARVRAIPRGTFLMGGFFPGGTRAYLPALLVAKTPLALAVAALLGIALPQGRALLRGHRAFLVAALFFLVVAIASNVNLGHRHLTPFLPAVWLAGAAGLVAVARTFRRGRALAGLLGTVLVLEGGLAHPHYLPFTNAAFGGIDNAHRVAVDSATDWGQDLPLLAAWLRAQPPAEGPVHLAYFGTADPAAYGIESVWRPCRPLGRPRPPGAPAAPCDASAQILAVSATCLQGAAGGDSRDACWERLRDVQPEVILGGSILVFRDVLGTAIPVAAP